MSHFQCGKCGLIQVDSGAAGYTAGCCHHPPEDDREVLLEFRDGKMSKGFYRGAFYLNEQTEKERKFVHPVQWCDARIAPAEYREY